MSFRTELAKIALMQINLQTLVQFEEMTEEIDLFETAVAEYDGGDHSITFPESGSRLPGISIVEN